MVREVVKYDYVPVCVDDVLKVASYVSVVNATTFSNVGVLAVKVMELREIRMKAVGRATESPWSLHYCHAWLGRTYRVPQCIC